jgi:hypothetical protein
MVTQLVKKCIAFYDKRSLQRSQKSAHEPLPTHETWTNSHPVSFLWIRFSIKTRLSSSPGFPKWPLSLTLPTHNCVIYALYFFLACMETAMTCLVQRLGYRLENREVVVGIPGGTRDICFPKGPGRLRGRTTFVFSAYRKLFFRAIRAARYWGRPPSCIWSRDKKWV